MEQKERKIYLTELIKCICKNKVKVVVGSIVITVLFVGAMFGLDLRSYNKAIKDKEEIENIEDEENLEDEELLYEEQKVVDNIILMQDRVLFYENYLEKSYLMNMDVYNVKRIVLRYYLDSEYTFDMTSNSELDYTTSVLEMYYMYLAAPLFQNQIMEGLEKEYIKELFTITTNYDAKTLGVFVYVPESIDAEAIKAQIKQMLDEKEVEFQKYGKHDLILQVEDLAEQYDSGIESTLYSTRKTLSDTRSQVIELTKDLSESQIEYLKEYYDYEEEEEEEEESLVKPGFKIANILLGIGAGAIIMCGYYVLSSILSGKLQCEDDIRVMYGLNVLGLYTGGNMDEYLATKIKCICKKDNINHILLVGSVTEDIACVENVISLLKKNDIKLEIMNSIMNDATSYEKMCEVNDIILVEKKYVSKYNDIAEEIQTVMENKSNIIGAIVIE